MNASPSTPTPSLAVPLSPGARPRALANKARLGLRWTRFGLRALLEGQGSFARSGFRAACALAGLTLREHLPSGSATVRCNLCGWSGPSFYPNVGRGYDERNVTCPGCDTLGRHRSLLVVLATQTGFFRDGGRVIEVAPRRGFQAYCLGLPRIQYTSFDLHRFAMRKDDLCRMSFADESADYFLCFHVLEHVPDEHAALGEIWRVLAPGGQLLIQVPMDRAASRTVEYERPDPLDAFHVRRYGLDFPERIAARGFSVRQVDIQDCADPATVRRLGLDREPIFLARKGRAP